MGWVYGHHRSHSAFYPWTRCTKALQCPLFICALRMNTNHSYPHDPHAPTCFYGHINMLMCTLQSHKFTTKQSPIHSQDSVNTFTPLSSFPFSINTYTRTTKPAHRCKAAECVCVSRSINERGTSREGRMARGRDCQWVGRQCSKEGVVDAALSLSHGRRDLPPGR